MPIAAVAVANLAPKDAAFLLQSTVSEKANDEAVRRRSRRAATRTNESLPREPSDTAGAIAKARIPGALSLVGVGASDAKPSRR